MILNASFHASQVFNIFSPDHTEHNGAPLAEALQLKIQLPI